MIVWDKVFGLGTIDPITGLIADWSGMILTAYVGGRSIEKVARILRRQRRRLPQRTQSMPNRLDDISRVIGDIEAEVRNLSASVADVRRFSEEQHRENRVKLESISERVEKIEAGMKPLEKKPSRPWSRSWRATQ